MHPCLQLDLGANNLVSATELLNAIVSIILLLFRKQKDAEGRGADALIYPGLGLGAIVCKSRIVSDGMIIAGAQRLAALSPALKDPDDALLPDFGDAPSVNFEVAVAVAKKAIEEGSAGDEAAQWKEEEVRSRVRERAWRPVYGDYYYDENGED